MMSQSVTQARKHTRALLAGVDTLIVNAKQVDLENSPREKQTLSKETREYLCDWQELAKKPPLGRLFG